MTDTERIAAIRLQAKDNSARHRHGWLALYGADVEWLLERVDRLAAVERELVEQRVLGHGEGQEHTIADVNADRIDDLIAPRLERERAALAAMTREREAIQQAMAQWEAGSMANETFRDELAALLAFENDDAKRTT